MLANGNDIQGWELSLLIWHNLAMQGIELKTTESNVLLGQAHLQSGGKFVAAQPGRKQALHASGSTSRVGA
jgi:hypothetical protein